MDKKKPQLEEEMATYTSHLGELQKDNPQGGYVVIKDDEVLGVRRDRVDALQAGVEKYGDVQFLVRDIFADNKRISFSRELSFAE